MVLRTLLHVGPPLQAERARPRVQEDAVSTGCLTWQKCSILLMFPYLFAIIWDVLLPLWAPCLYAFLVFILKPIL